MESMIQKGPLTRREFLKYAWLTFLATLGSSAAIATLASCAPVPIVPERVNSPIPVEFAWIGSSTARDIVRLLKGEQNLSDINEDRGESYYNPSTKSFAHGRYKATIDEVINYLDQDEIRGYIPEHINIIIGGNEITNYSIDTDEKLQIEARKITKIIEKAESNFIMDPTIWTMA